MQLLAPWRLPEIDTWKSGRTSAVQGPPKPQNIGFRMRGSGIQQKHTNLQKVKKSLPKASQTATKVLTRA